MKQSHITTQSVPRETFAYIDELIQKNQDKLEHYLEQLLWWNQRVNLVSRDVPRETVWEHIRHSLVICNLPSFQQHHLFIDTGTGGGLPGIPLAITHPGKHFVLNDLVTKKCLALKQMARQLELKNIGIIDGSIEHLQHNEECILISKHAFKIGDLYKMSSHLSWKKMIFYKGINFKDELKGFPESLKITCLTLEKGFDFYQGKAILIIDCP